MDKQRKSMKNLIRDRLALFEMSLVRVQNAIKLNLKKYMREKYNTISLAYINDVIINKQMLYFP